MYIYIYLHVCPILEPSTLINLDVENVPLKSQRILSETSSVKKTWEANLW